MPRGEGNAHGRHFDEQDHVEDENRNYNQAKGRRHFTADEEQHAGGHSDRWADSASADAEGRQHEFRSEDSQEDVHRHDQPQSEGSMQGESRSEGGHEGGRNQKNSR